MFEKYHWIHSYGDRYRQGSFELYKLDTGWVFRHEYKDTCYISIGHNIDESSLEVFQSIIQMLTNR